MPWKDPMELLSKLGDFLLEKVLIIVPVVVISLIAIKIIMKLVDRMLGRLPLEDAIKRLIRTAVKVLLLAVAAIVLMSCLEIPVTSFVALLSVVGLALSLSIQNFLSNVFAGLQLLASKPFKVGDYVDAGNCSGTVYEVGLFYTKLTSVDNKLIQLPNSTIVGSNVVNYSSQTHRRVEIKVTASYDAPTEKVKGVLSRLVDASAIICVASGSAAAKFFNAWTPVSSILTFPILSHLSFHPFPAACLNTPPGRSSPLTAWRPGFSRY